MSFYSNNFLNPLGGGYSPVGTQGVTYAGRGILDGYEPIEFSEQCNDVYVQEKHVSVIRKGPTSPPTLEMYAYTREDQQPDGFIDIIVDFDGGGSPTVNPFKNEVLKTTGASFSPPQYISGFYNSTKTKKVAGQKFFLPFASSITDFKVGDIVSISLGVANSFGQNSTVACRAVIVSWTSATSPIECQLLTNTEGFPIQTDASDIYTVSLEQADPMFELKFPKFGYRYKYEDGEYSVFSPWSQIAFIPGEFDYMPKKGYNLGMSNRLRSLKVLDWVPKNMPKDVVQVDLLFKQANSPNVYTVESFKKDDVVDPLIGGPNPWNTPGTGKNLGSYTVESELIHATVASNQMLRPWDNVPRVALSQEITANRLVFANYIQNYDTVDYTSSPPTEIKPMFEVAVSYTNVEENPELSRLPGKSLKSMRSYQLGVVYRDRYGRETPVLTSNSGTFKVKKNSAKNYNKLNVGLSSAAPDWAESFTIYIKETANEYYNLAMDRWYDAEDGGVWVSFPSSERNKIDDDTVLYLKKQHDSDQAVDTDVEYKVISIKNNAPNFIKTDKQFWGSAPMMLPPAGWGVAGRPGSMQAGMFGTTGLPIQGRLYLDIYAEYADNTILAGLKSMTRDGLEIRVTQSSNTFASALGVVYAGDTNHKSNWYGVSRVSYIGEEPTTYTESYTDPSTGITTEVEKEETNAKHPLIRLTLDKVMQKDMAFTEPNDSLDLARGLALEVRNARVKDKAQFEGRFFVKLFRSNDLVRNIINPSNPIGESMYVKESKGIKYLCDAHPGVQDWSHHVTTHKPLTSYDNTNSINVFTNYIPPGIDLWQGGTDVFANFTAPDPKLVDTQHNGKPWTVSSYSGSSPGGYLVLPQNGMFDAPIDCWDGASPSIRYYGQTNEELGCWPFSPGPDNGSIWKVLDQTIEIYDDGASEPVFAMDNTLTPPALVQTNTLVSTQIIPGNPNYGNYDVAGWADEFGNPRFYAQRHAMHTDANGQTPGSSPTPYNWPSFIPSQWVPGEGYNFHSPYIDPSSTGIGFNYQDVVNNANATLFSLDPGGSGGLAILGTRVGKNQGASFNLAEYFNELTNSAPPVNPWMKPAIWGDDQFVPTPWLRSTFASGGLGGMYLTNAGPLGTTPTWDELTIDRLNRDWMGYWNGGDSTYDTEWPNVKKSWDRWFIDKVGAAENYSGAGIYDTDGVSHMSISFWGIGNPENSGPITDSHDLSYHQESELSFANSLGTVGTMFRFKQDPDQTVYTITSVSVEKVFNYEGYHGGWGYLSDPTDITSVNYGGLLPPVGPLVRGPESIAGRQKFYSDLWQSPNNQLKREKTGRAMQNNRLRFNLVLDKEIGSGPNAFHPITNHTEPALANDPNVIAYDEWVLGGAIPADKPANGYPAGTLIANIPTAYGVRDRVAYDKTAADHVGLEKGGTPCPLGDAGANEMTDYSADRYRYYNLSSWWNATNASLLEQPDNMFHDFYTGAGDFAGNETSASTYIGLHERGLNETTIEIVDWYDGEDSEQRMSNNPAIFETEPREDVGMDLYYAASPSYPVNLKRYRFDMPHEGYAQEGWYDYGLRGEEFIEVGSTVVHDVNGSFAQVDGVEQNRIWINTPLVGLAVGDALTFNTKGEGSYYGIKIDNNYVTAIVSKFITTGIFEIEPEVHSNRRSLNYFNCYSFGNGVESNRIRDDYNAVTIDKGVKVSAPLAEGYEEERKASSFIFSGIYNSTSGVNRTNQFVQAEPITKDLNPINGSIQKLFARDTDLVTFCENKVFKVLAKKDALFNADGNKNVTSNAAVLGATIPFEGEYGISRNPESFASESYRVYFTDKDRGAVLRLSKSGLKPISDKGMKDWFKDNLMDGGSLMGSYDNRNDHYNLTIETKDQDLNDNAFTLSFTEDKGGGWVSFKSFITQGGLTYKNKYYTFPSNNFNNSTTAVGSAARKLYGNKYGDGVGTGDMWQHHVDLDFHRYVNSGATGTNVTLVAGAGVVVAGMNVEGNGINIDTTVASTPTQTTIILSKPVSVGGGEKLRFTSSRNNFYKYQSHSMVRTLFNGDQGTVKRFKSLNYEGSQGKTIINTSDNYYIRDISMDIAVGQVYENNYPKKGWEVSEIKTDLQDGKISEFISKENKWFNYILGNEGAGLYGDDVDTSEFSAQGIGFTTNFS